MIRFDAKFYWTNLIWRNSCAVLYCTAVLYWNVLRCAVARSDDSYMQRFENMLCPFTTISYLSIKFIWPDDLFLLPPSFPPFLNPFLPPSPSLLLLTLNKIIGLVIVVYSMKISHIRYVRLIESLSFHSILSTSHRGQLHYFIYLFKFKNSRRNDVFACCFY